MEKAIYQCPHCRAEHNLLPTKSLDSQPVEPSIVVSYPNDSGLVGHFRSNNGVTYKNGDRFYDQRTIDTLQYELQRVTEERDKFKSYWQAIDNAMVVMHLGTADSFDADTCLGKLMEWATTIALDPQVSRPAQELKDTYLKRAEKAEEANRRSGSPAIGNQPAPVDNDIRKAMDAAEAVHKYGSLESKLSRR